MELTAEPQAFPNNCHTDNKNMVCKNLWSRYWLQWPV